MTSSSQPSSSFRLISPINLFELCAKPNIRPSAVRYYKRGIEQYTVLRIGTTKLSKLTSQEIQNLYKDLL